MISFAEFCTWMAPVFPFLHLTVAVKCVMLHSQKEGVLLLVDEVMKFEGKEVTVQKVVRRIGACLDLLPTFNTVVTTLHKVAFIGEIQKTGRLIKWITLPPAKLMESKSLFGRAAIDNCGLAQCISDCNGHFRSLETLKVVWDKEGCPGISYSSLINKLADEMDRKYGGLSLNLIRAALSRAHVRYDAQVHRSSLPTYGDCVAMGLLLNTPGDDLQADKKYDDKPYVKATDTVRYFIPRISPLQLFMFARVNIVVPPGSLVIISHSLLSLFHILILSQRYECAVVIMRMLELEPNSNQPQYEEFHANWECLMRYG